MKRWLAVLAVALVCGGALWLVGTGDDGAPASVARDAGAEPRADGEQPGPETLVEPATPARELTAGAEPRDASARSAALPHADELAGATWIEGRVVFPPGTPADEACSVTATALDLVSRGRRAPEHTATVANDGTFRVALSPRSKFAQVALAGRWVFLQDAAHWQPGDGPLVLEARLGGRIEGVLVPDAASAASLAPSGSSSTPSASTRSSAASPAPNGPTATSSAPNASGSTSFAASGAPPRGGTVQMRRFGSARLGGVLEPRAPAAVDAGGRFAFGGLPGDSSYELEHRSEGWVGFATVQRVEPGRTVEVALSVTRPARIAGVVRGASGEPLPARVTVRLERGPIWTLPDDIVAGADGRFAAGPLWPGDVALQAEHAGRAPARLTLRGLAPGEVREGIELVLPDGAAVSGRAVLADGTPVAGARITASPERPTWPPRDGDLAVVARDDGSFRIAGLEPGGVRLSATLAVPEEPEGPEGPEEPEQERRGRRPLAAELRDVPPGSADLVLVLRPGARLAGRVVDEQGLPVTSFSVTAFRDSDTRGLGRVSGQFADPGGAFALEDVAPGAWRLEARADGHAVALPPLVTAPAEDVVLVLPRAAVVRGVVLDAQGRAQEGAHVVAELRSYRPVTAETDARGAFALERLPAGEVRVWASAPPAAPTREVALLLDPGEVVEDLELRLSAGGSVEGVVLRADGSPVAGVGVMGAYRNRGDLRAVTDASGAFALSGVPAGAVRIVASVDGLPLSEEVAVVDGAVVRVRLVVPDVQLVRVHGRVRVAGEPVSSGTLWVRSLGPGPGLTGGGPLDPGGGYEARVPPGEVDLSARVEPQGFHWRTTAAVPAALEHRLDLDIPVGTLAGRALDERGEPAPGVRVVVQASGGRDAPSFGQFGATGADGRFELLVPAGECSLTLHGFADRTAAAGPFPFVAARVEGLAVSSGRRTDAGDVVLRAGGFATGRVVDAQGAPLAGAGVWLLSGARPERIGLANLEGRFRTSALLPGDHVLAAGAPDQSPRDGAERVSVRIEVGATTALEADLVP